MFTSLLLKVLNREAASAVSQPGTIIESLGIREGYEIADFGSGGGYFTLAFAEKVGASGRVHAIDLKTAYLDFVRRSAERAGLKNVDTVPATGAGLPLRDACLDLIFARNVYHHLSEPENSFRELRRFLKPGGRVAIIEHKPKRGLGFIALFKHHTRPENIVRDMERAGYALTEQFDFLPQQTFLLFNVK